MKKLLFVLMALGLGFGAFAQRGHAGSGHVVVVRPRVVVGVGAYSPFYNPYYYGFGFGYPFSPFGYPYGYGYPRESKLDMQIDDIRSDYSHQIKDVRHDKSLTRSERKQKIRDLKFEREKEITQAKRDYYERRRRPQNNSTQPGQQGPSNPTPQNQSNESNSQQGL